MRLARSNELLALLFILFALHGCSGGGGGTVPPPSMPSTPTGIVVTADDGANVLQWNAVAGAAGYNIYWSTASGAGLSGTKLTGVSSPYTHDGLSNGTTYYYVITAVNSAGESAPTTETSGTPASPPPDAPSLSAVPGDQQVTLSWSAEAGVTSYNLYWSTTGGAAAAGTKIANVTSPYQHAGLTNGITYYYVLTAVNSEGESRPSAEVSATPFVPPYATEGDPYDLGTPPVAGHEETLLDKATFLHYMVQVTPGSVYMFTVDNVRDGARLEVFKDTSWEEWGLGVECYDYVYPYSKSRPQCVAVGPETGILYVRLGTTTDYPETVSLRVDEIINQGSDAAPVDLGTAPMGPAFGTVLEGGESVYRVAVTPGKGYRVMLADWEDSGASLSTLSLNVYDGTARDTLLCGDYGGNSSVDHQHRLRTIHCLARPATGFLTIVSSESLYGKGATYDVVVEVALNEGTPAAPLQVSGDAVVHHGEITADADALSSSYAYYQLALSPTTYYMVDLRGMHEELELMVTTDPAFATAVCGSRESNLIDESCLISSDAEGNLYVRVEITRGLTDTFILSAMEKPGDAVPPARYPDEGTDVVPIALGSALPIAGRLSTVGAGASHYSVEVTPGSVVQVSATEMNADVDVLVYSDAYYLNRLCASRNSGSEDDRCAFTVPDGIGTVYVVIDGQFTTNNGSWSSGTETDVGAMFRLSVE